MRNAIRVPALLVFLFSPSVALGHGGVFPPPYVRPGGGGGAQAPKRPQSPMPTPKAGPATPAPSGPKAPPRTSTPAPATISNQGPDITDWTWWWAFNEDPYVDLRRRVRAPSSLSGTEAFYVGQSTRPKTASLGPGRSQLQDQVGPALLRIIDEERETNLLAAALVALGKLHPNFEPPDGRTPVDIVAGGLSDRREQVVQASILALGLIAEPEAARLLVNIASDEESAKKLFTRSSIPERWRVSAAMSMGLVGSRTEREEIRRFLVSSLARILTEESFAAPDLHLACVTAIGMTPLKHSAAASATRDRRGPTAASSRLGQIQLLLEVLKDGKRQLWVRAHAPRAIALLAMDAVPEVRDAAKRALMEELGRRNKVKTLIRYGLVESLGLLGDGDAEKIDADLRDLLHQVVRDGDIFERNLALISIALSSSRPGYGGGPALDALRGEQVYLMKFFTKAKSRSRPWAALALGLQGYHARAAGEDLFDSTSKALRWTFERTRSPIESGAYCIAFGLRRDQEAIELMLDRLEDLGDDAARGRVAISLGLVGAQAAIEPLEAIVKGSRYHPSLLRDAAVALALLGHKQVGEDLVEILVDGNSSAVRGAAVSAIGFVGDGSVVQPLIDLLVDEGQQDLVRASAATALGLVCEEEPFHWTAKFNNHMNYTALVDTLSNPQGTGFLNRR